MHYDPPGQDDDLRADPDVPGDIRYDPDLAVHEPMEVPAEAPAPSRRRAPLLFFPLGILVLALVVYVLFGLIAHEGKTSVDYVNDIRQGRGGAWQTAYELSRLIPTEDPAERDPRLVAGIVSLLGRSAGADPRLRRYLILSLGELRDRRAVDTLLDALEDPDPESRLYAVWGLGAIGETRAAAPLLKLLDAPDAGVRKITAYALGSLPAPGVIASLRRVLHDPSQDVAWNAALALARLGDAAGVPVITRLLDRTYLDAVTSPDASGRVRALPEDRKEEIMINALRSLGGLGDKTQVALIQSLRDADPSLNVRQAAFEALRRIEKADRY